MRSLVLVSGLLVLNGGFISKTDGSNREGSGLAQVHSDRIQTAYYILKRIPAAKRLLEGVSVETLFQWSTESRTNAIITRYFNPSTGEEHREREVTVFLKRNQTLASLVIDIAHELTHAQSAPVWDPYDPHLTPGKYLLASLEGPGGEVEAMLMECQVALTLNEKYGVPLSRCQRYWNASLKKMDRNKIREDFYRVGSWASNIKKNLGEEAGIFPLLKNQQPSLYSSTGKAPYPVALLREYAEMTRTACENTRNRLLKSRKPAQAQGGSHRAVGMDSFLSQRCQSLSAPL